MTFRPPPPRFRSVTSIASCSLPTAASRRPLPKVGDSQIAEDNGLRLGLVLKLPGRLFQDGRCRPGVVQEEITRACQPTRLRWREQVDRRIVGLDAAELSVGGAEGLFAVAAAAEHRVCLGSMEQGQAGEDPADSLGYASRVLGEGESRFRVPPPVEGDEALAQQRQSLGRLVAQLPGGLDSLVKVGDSCGVIAALGCIPDELPHQRGSLSFGRAQFAPHVGARGVAAEEHNVAQIVPCFRDQCRRGPGSMP